ALRKKSEVRDLGRGEKLGRTVRALGHTRTALNALRGVHGPLLGRFRDRDGVRFRRATRIHGDESAGLNDAIERAAIDDEVLDDRKCARPPRLDADHVAVFEMAHVQLTGSRSAHRSVSDSIDHHSARSADALAAIVLEVNRLLPFLDQLLVDDVEHFEEGGIRTDVARLVLHKAAFAVAGALSPAMQRQIHLYDLVANFTSS